MSEIADWIRLTSTTGIGCEAAHKLLLAFGLPENIFSASYSDLAQVVSARQAKAVCASPADSRVATRIERTHQWCEQPNNHFITLADPRYPANLLHIPDPPVLLYITGHLELLSRPSLAVVGSRNATQQGILHAEQFSQHLSQAGITITSGLALGIDAAAHQGALEGAGSTIAIIGTGIDLIYPVRHRGLAQQIAEKGCIVSEYPLNTPPMASNFPRRNRLISGLSHGVLVIEAAMQSGSLITARLAAEHGRDVFAIPGSIHSPLSKGCHFLIKQGAKLVDSAQDILQELPRQTSAGPLAPSAAANTIAHPIVIPIDLAAKESVLLQEIGYEPVHPDVVAQRCNLSSHDLSERLLNLELEGLVELMAGGLVRRLHRMH